MASPADRGIAVRAQIVLHAACCTMVAFIPAFKTEKALYAISIFTADIIKRLIAALAEIKTCISAFNTPVADRALAPARLHCNFKRLAARRLTAGFAPCILRLIVHSTLRAVVGGIFTASPAEETLLTAVAARKPLFASRADVHTTRPEVFPVRFIEI